MILEETRTKERQVHLVQPEWPPAYFNTLPRHVTEIKLINYGSFDLITLPVDISRLHEHDKVDRQVFRNQQRYPPKISITCDTGDETDWFRVLLTR